MGETRRIRTCSKKQLDGSPRGLAISFPSSSKTCPPTSFTQRTAHSQGRHSIPDVRCLCLSVSPFCQGSPLSKTMMKLLRLPLAVAVLALAACWLGAGVHALKPVPSKTAVKAIPPPPARKADVSHKLNTFDMMIAVRASSRGGQGGGLGLTHGTRLTNTHRVALPRPWATWPCTPSIPSRRSNKRRLR